MGDSTHQGDIKMMANGSEQAGKAPRNVTLLVMGCSSCALAVGGMLATETEMLGMVSAVGLGMIIVVTRLGRRMRNAWRRRRRQRAGAVQKSNVARPLLPVDILPDDVSANSGQTAA
jgi:hypothetical protein